MEIVVYLVLAALAVSFVGAILSAAWSLLWAGAAVVYMLFTGKIRE